MQRLQKRNGIFEVNGGVRWPWKSKNMSLAPHQLELYQDLQWSWKQQNISLIGMSQIDMIPIMQCSSEMATRASTSALLIKTRTTPELPCGHEASKYAYLGSPLTLTLVQ
jgi:hypothetical protein